jgi:GntR family transcriptional regulator
MKGADFVVRINKASSKPYYEQLVLSIKEDILNGVLTAGDQVPSVREMA